MKEKLKKRSASAGRAFCLALVAFILPALGGQAAVENTPLPKPTTPIKNLSIVIFDTETTGFSAANDRVVELGAVKIQNGKILATTNWLINPGRKIPKWATDVHGITTAMVKKKPTFGEIYPQFKAFIGDSILMAHNAPFDVRFIRAEVERAAQPMPGNAVLDTLKLFRVWYPEASSHRIGALADFIGLKPDEELHRGDVDAEVTGLILIDGINRHPNVKTLRHLLGDAGGTLAF